MGLVGCALTGAAVASRIGADLDTTMREVVLTPPNATTTNDAVRITIVQVFFPGVPDRFACRMQILAVNKSERRVNLRAQLNTFDDSSTSVDTWLVPTGDLEPGKEAQRTYSCKQASTLVIDRETPYGWPQTCMVDGEERSPCPITLKINSSLTMPSDSRTVQR